jgi:hypothetical protein
MVDGRSQSDRPAKLASADVVGDILGDKNTYNFIKQLNLNINMKCIGAPERIRTSDPLIRSQVLYPAELRVH